MKTPAFRTYDAKKLSPILIIDKIGVIGEELALEFSKDFLVVFLSSSVLKTKNERIIHIPFKKRIPRVPDNAYSKYFIIDDGDSITRQSCSSFIKRASETNSELFFIGSLRNIDIQHADEITSSYSRAKVLIFGDLFDKNIFFDKNSSVNQYILQARKTGKIQVAGNGLSLSFPMSFSDTIKLIIKASYLNLTQKVILLFYPHPITDISLANIFQRINPELKVDFVNDKRDKKIYIPRGAEHAISKYDLEKNIKELNLEDVENRELKIVSKRDDSKKSYVKPFLAAFLAVIFVLLLPLITTFFYSFLGARELVNAKNQAMQGNLDKSIKNAQNSNSFFKTAEKTSEPLVAQARFLRKGSSATALQAKIVSGEDLSRATIYLLEGANTFKKIYSGKSLDPKGDFSSGSNSLKSAVSLIQKVKAEGELPAEFENDFNKISPLVDLFSNSSEILPQILGFEKEQTYLVLLQNNMELRPGGGFIGSYGILKIKNAKVTDFKISDVYQTDGALKAHVEPPFPIRRYLPSANLYLRDSNFDPDFVGSAVSASNIYALETKNKVDGVIGINLSFAKDIISALGPITVADYNKTIDENNFYQVTQSESQDNSFPGSTQKKDFLSALANSIQLNLETRQTTPYLPLAEKVGQSIEEKNLTFAFSDGTFQNIFTANDWSSSLWDNRVEESNSVNDYLGISEANLGVNKVNYYVSRSVSKKVTVSQSGKVSSKLTLAFKNNSKATDKLGGTYKNYLQLILPPGSRITSISIDGKDEEIVDAVTDYTLYESKGFKPPKGLEVEEKKEIGKSVFGFLVMVPPSQIKTVTLNYDLPYSVSKLEKSFNYSLKLYKQPGIDSYPFDLSFSFPQNYQILNKKSSYSQEITKDQDFNFTLAQK